MELFILPVITTAVLVLRILLSVKNPPYITTDKRSKDIINVCTWELRKGGGFYRRFLFVKRKNGKYSLRYSTFDLFCLLVPLIGISAGVCLIVFYNLDGITEFPEIWIPFFIVLFISMAELYVFVIFSQIDARIHFRKYGKKN